MKFRELVTYILAVILFGCMRKLLGFEPTVLALLIFLYVGELDKK